MRKIIHTQTLNKEQQKYILEVKKIVKLPLLSYDYFTDKTNVNIHNFIFKVNISQEELEQELERILSDLIDDTQVKIYQIESYLFITILNLS